MRDIEITIRVYNQDRHTEERRVHTNQSGEDRMNDLLEILGELKSKTCKSLPDWIGSKTNRRRRNRGPQRNWL